MTRLLLLLVLVGCFYQTGWAEPKVDQPAEADDNIQLLPDTGTDMDSAASQISGEMQFAQRVRSKVLDAVLAAIEDDSDLSSPEKSAAKRVLQDDELQFVSGASPYAGLNILDRPDGVWVGAVAILAIVLIFGTPIMLVAAVLYAGHRKRRLASDMASRFLANGQQVPPEVWRGLSGDASSGSALHKGMIMLGIGFGVFLCFWLIGSVTAAYLGLIPMFIGVAQLLIWKLEKQKVNPGE